jgi:hypothetical protein
MIAKGGTARIGPGWLFAQARRFIELLLYEGSL